MNAADTPYDQLRMRYADSLARKRDDLEQAWRVFAEEPGDAAAQRGLHVQIHRLSGSAPSYGYAHLGVLAHGLDDLMSQPEALAATPATFARALEKPILALLDALVEAAALAINNPPDIP